MPGKNGFLSPIGMGNSYINLLPGGQFVEAKEAQPVILVDTVIVGRIGKGQWQYPLFLKIGLVNPGKTAHQHRAATKKPRAHRGVLAGTALTVVLIADRDPTQSFGLVGASDFLQFLARLPGQHVKAGARLVGERIIGSGEHVITNAIEMATEPEPRPRG